MRHKQANNTSKATEQMNTLTGYENAINSSNKSAAAKVLNLPFEAIASVEEQGNAYYVKLKKGFGRSTFIAKPRLIEEKRESHLQLWMQDFIKKGISKIQIGTASGGMVRDFGYLNYTNLELAIYEYRKGLKMANEEDLVIIGQFDKRGGYRAVDSYYPQFDMA